MPDKITFGTDGWRSRLDEGFTARNLARVAEGTVAAWQSLHPDDVRPVLVGGDTREGRNQVVADTLKIVSSAFMGLTLGCSQCHNHR